MSARSRERRRGSTAWLPVAAAVMGALVGCGQAAVDGVVPQDGGARQDGGVTSSGSVTLTVRPISPGGTPNAGRLAVVWFQLSDDGPDPVPEVGYDVLFRGDETRVEVPLAAVAPPSEANLFCPRMCDDEARCPCTGEPRIGVGLVLVLGDTNGNGRADFAGFRAEGDAVLGVAQVVMGYSATAYPAVAEPRERVFPGAIARGVSHHALDQADPSVRPRIGVPDPAAAYPLAVCATTGCRVALPNLF